MTKDEALPPLPEPYYGPYYGVAGRGGASGACYAGEWFTVEQMRAYAISAVDAAMKEQSDQWHKAVDDELVCFESTADSFSSPKEAVRALIDWHVSVALDPAVSSDAVALIERGRQEVMKEQAEPVGYLPAYELDRLQSGHDGRLRSAKFGASVLDGDVAVYTAPPQRKPLSEEQLWQLSERHQSVESIGEFVALVRAVERAHGIGGDE